MPEANVALVDHDSAISGRLRRSMPLTQRAANLAHLLDTRGIVHARSSSSATAWADLGEAPKAFGYHEQALAVSREIGDRVGEAAALYNFAAAMDALGKRADPIGLAKASLVIARQNEAPQAAMVTAWLRERGVDPDAAG